MCTDCYYMCLDDFPEAERRAVLVHKWFLSERVGHDVGEEFAIHDWLDNYATEWRRHRLEIELDQQKREMEKHRWLESEKAHRDLGTDAYRDWIIRYAAAWRAWYHGSEPGERLA